MVEDEEVFNLRKKCLENIDKVREEMGTEKKLRDSANSEVKKAKEERDKLTKDLSIAQKELNEALKTAGELKNFDKHAYLRLKAEYDDMNWKYQTEPVSVKKEKEIVKWNI